MLQIVGALILLIAGFAILRLLFRALISTASALAGLILLCLFGPALLAGYITERITRLFHIRWLAGVFLTIAGMIISFMWGLDGKHIALEAHTFDSVRIYSDHRSRRWSAGCSPADQKHSAVRDHTRRYQQGN